MIPVPIGRRRRQVQEDLAAGTMTQQQIADKYETSQGSIADFAKRWSAVIEDMRADAGNEFAGMWIAQKKERVSELEQDVELMIAYNNLVNPDGKQLDATMLRLKKDYLKQAAEELGQFTQKVDLSTDSVVTYTIEGVDMDQV